MLSKIRLPSWIAETIVAKLSSASIMDDDSLATSVPVIPIAIPIWAAFNAGASFTPSPVTATICPFSFNVSTIFSFCSGNTLE